MDIRPYIRNAPLVAVYFLAVLATFFWKLAAGRWLSPEDFGTIMFTISAMGLVSAAIYSSTATYIVRESAKRRMSLAEAGGLAMAAALLVSIATASLLPLVGTIALLLAWYQPIYGYWSGPANYQRGRGDRRFLRPLLAFSIAIILAGLAIRFTHSLTVAAVAFALAYVVPAPLYRYKPRFRISSHVRRILGFVPLALGRNALVNIDVIMVGALLGYTSVAAYRAASLISRPLMILAEAAAFVFMPAASRNPERIAKNLGKALIPLVALSSAYILALLALGPEILPLVYAGKYGEAFPVVLVLSVFSAIHAVLYTANQSLLAWDAEKVLARWTVLGALANAALNAFLIPSLGILGAAVATGIALLVSDIPPALFFLRRIAFNHNTQ